MPYRSRAQAAYFHIRRKELEQEGVDVSEWDRASKGKKLPEHVRDRAKKSLKKRAEELLRGGVADGVSDSHFNQKNLDQGTTHEMEHVRDMPHAREMAKETAKDHLLEHPSYYKKLEKIFPEKQAGQYSGLPRSFFKNLYYKNPELHKKLSRRGGKVGSGVQRVEKDRARESVEREARIQAAMQPPQKPQGEFGFMKESNENLKGLLTTNDLKDVKKYILGKNELEKNRELSPEEEERLHFRRTKGWSWGNPLDDTQKRDVFHHIQNPYYRSIIDTTSRTGGELISGASLGGTLGLFSGLRPGGIALASGVGAALSATPRLLQARQNIRKQKLYNDIVEEYIRSHPEGDIQTMQTILREMLHKGKAVNSLKDPKVKVKQAEEEDELSKALNKILKNNPEMVKKHSTKAATEAPASKMKNMARGMGGLGKFMQWYSGIGLGLGFAGGIYDYRRGNKEIHDVRDRFERKRQDKREADIFLHKARVPLYKEHMGSDRKIQELEHLFKQSADNSPLLPHQQRVIERLKKNDQPGLILMHGLGSGKTRSSIEAYKALGLPAEVVVPAALRENYEKELKKWVGGHPKDLNIRSQQMVGRDGADPEDFDGKLMIVDEAHRMRNADTKLFNSLKKVSPAKRLLLTGTPIYNHPADIAKLINVASGHKIMPENQPEFEQEYIHRKTVFPTIGHRILGVSPGQELSVKNRDYLRAVFKKMIDYHGGSEEGFPDVKDETVRVPMDPDQQRIYKALMKDLPWHLRLKVRAGLPPNKKELDKLIPFLSGARMISNSSEGFTPEGKGKSPKIEQAARYLQERIKEDPSYKALVYSNYLGSGVNPYKKLLDEAKIPYGEFTGEINDRVRNQLVKDYNENRLKALLVSSAGGEGLDLKGTRLVQLLEPHFNNEKIRQVIGRAARYRSHEGLPEDKRNVLVQHYLSTLNPGLIDRVRGKRRTSADEYLQNLSDQKERLNNEFIKLIKD